MNSDPVEPRLILLRYSGEVSIKYPKTKQRFIKRLDQNVKNALGTTGVRYETEREWHRMIVETESPLALDILPHVFGLQSVSPIARHRWRDLSDLVNQGEAFFAEAVRGKRFAVRARRAGKTQLIPFRSMDVQYALGTALLEHADRVDLRTPEVTAFLEIYPEEAYLFTEMIPAEGGLPVGVQGRALSLVSGGFDSAVASWMLLRRGVSLDYLFCNLGGPAHRRGVLRVMKIIADHVELRRAPPSLRVRFPARGGGDPGQDPSQVLAGHPEAADAARRRAPRARAQDRGPHHRGFGRSGFLADAPEHVGGLSRDGSRRAASAGRHEQGGDHLHRAADRHLRPLGGGGRILRARSQESLHQRVAFGGRNRGVAPRSRAHGPHLLRPHRA